MLDALIPQLPADSDVYMELNEPPIIDAGLEDGIITPSMLALEGEPVEGGYYSVITTVSSRCAGRPGGSCFIAARRA